MPVILQGFPEFERRLTAIAEKQTFRGSMRQAGLAMVGELKLGVPRKTGTTGRSIRLGTVTDNSAQIVGSKVATYLDTGTGLFGPYHHRIVPLTKQFLRWKTGPSLRLSGRPRKGTASRYVYARSVAGMRPRPYINRALQRSANKVGASILAVIVERWNDAA